MKRILQTLIGSTAILADATSLAQGASLIAQYPALSASFGLIILAAFGWSAYKTYQEHRQSGNVEALKDYLQRLDQVHFASLRDAAQKIFIDSEGNINFELLDERERNNPYVLLFKLQTTQIENLDEKLDNPVNPISSQTTLVQSLNVFLYQYQEILINLISDYSTATITQIQNEFQTIRQELQAYIAQFHQAYNGQINHRPPLHISLLLDEESRKRSRFVSTSRWTPFIGRERELDELKVFLQSDHSFTWWLWTGSGGQGKTRLALELILEAQAMGWAAGIFRRGSAYEDWQQWQPEKDTLIIFDDAATQAEAVRNALLALAGCAGSYPHKVRVLLLERTYQEQEPWVKTIECRDSTTEKALIETHFYNQPGITPRQLEPLPEGIFLRIVADYYERCPEKQSQTTAARHELQQVLQKLPEGDYRPLFAAFAGEAVAENGIEAVRQRDTTELVKWVLDKEHERWNQSGVDAKHSNLFALATLVGGLPKKDAWQLAEKEAAQWIPTREKIDRDLLMLLASYSPRVDAEKYSGLEPDILGEFYILERLKGNYQVGPGDGIVQEHTTALIRIAWDYFPRKMARFLVRCAEDLAHHEAIMRLCNITPAPGSADADLYELVLAFVPANLARVGRDDDSNQLIERLPASWRALALYNRGVAYGELGQWEQALQDCTAVIEMPDTPAEQKALALYNRGVAYALQHELNKAIDDWCKVIQSPDAPPDLRAVAQALLDKIGRNCPP